MKIIETNGDVQEFCRITGMCGIAVKYGTWEGGIWGSTALAIVWHSLSVLVVHVVVSLGDYFVSCHCYADRTVSIVYLIGGSLRNTVAITDLSYPILDSPLVSVLPVVR